MKERWAFGLGRTSVCAVSAIGGGGICWLIIGRGGLCLLAGLGSLGSFSLKSLLCLAYLDDLGLETTKLFWDLITSLVNPIGLIFSYVGSFSLLEYRSHLGLGCFNPWSHRGQPY
jgi:hypothetical protein